MKMEILYTKRKDDLEGQKKGKVIKFGWIEGVYVSCPVSVQPPTV